MIFGKETRRNDPAGLTHIHHFYSCLLYTSDAADDLLCVDLGGRRIIKKKKKKNINQHNLTATTI